MPLLKPPGPDLGPADLSYTDAYNSIVSRVRRCGGSGSGGVVIFCGADVDGLMAARILVSLFKQDDVPYRLLPVGSYSELETKRDQAFANDEIHTLILLSLGSLLPLSQYFTLPKKCHLHIIDSHRPWNLSNLYGLDLDVADDEDEEDEEGSNGGRFWVWGDGDEANLDKIKKSWEALEYEPSESGSDTDDDESDRGEDDDDVEDDDEDEEEEGEDEEDEGDENGAGPSRKRPRSGSSGPRPPKKAKRDTANLDPDQLGRRLTRAARDAHHDRIQRYYESGTSWGMSVAQCIYLLATVLERADNDLLWLAILGTTHQYISNRISMPQYRRYHELFLDEVVRLNHEIIPTGTGIGRTPNPDDRSIQKSEELRFMLFRHWTLYDAMLHSGYVAGRLGIWKEKGRKKLQGLLAKMGFSLQQCTQAYPHMDTNLKRVLPEKLEAIAPEYGLVELSYPSFSRSFGFALSSLSAADAVEGFSALLEVAKGQRMEIEREGGRNGGEWFGGTRAWNITGREGEDKENVDPTAAGGENGRPKETQDGKKEQSWQVTNFWIAWDACEDVALMRNSLLLAKSLHTAIIRQGSSILDKASIRPLRTFRFCAIKEGPDLKLFSHPATLSRLALWLMDAARDKWAQKADKDKKKELPFVVAALDEERGSWLVVGITGGMEYGNVRKNKFGLAFQQAAEESGAGAKHDMFETSVVEVAKDDLTAFVECLHLRSI